MAQIPQYSYSGNLPRPGTIPQADPTALARPYAALAGVGESLQTVGGVVERIGEKQRSDEAIRWSSSATSKIANGLSEFYAANKDSETFAQDFKKHADELYAKGFADAPNEEARRRFEATARPHIDSLYGHALMQTETNKVQGAINSVQEDIGNLMQAARNNAKAANPAFAIKHFQPTYEALLNGIDQRYGTLAPKIAAKLKAMVTSQAVTGLAEIDPAHAQKILDGSAHIDETTRAALQNRIDAAINEHSALHSHQFQSDLKTRIQESEIGKVPVQRPSSDEFKTAFGKAAPWHEANFNAEADAIDSAVKNYAAIKDKNWAFQSATLAKMRTKLEEDARLHRLKPAEAAAFGKLYEWVNGSAEQQDKDPIGWQRQYQEPVAAAYRAAEEAQTSADQLAKDNPTSSAALEAAAEARIKRDAAWSMALQFQGHPPAGVSPEAAGFYLGKDEVNTHVLSPKQAEIYAEKIRTAGPNERAAIMRAWEQEYGDHFGHFRHDLMTMPPEGKRIPQGMELGLGIEDPNKQADYFRAQVNTDSIKALTDVKRSSLEKALDQDPQWMALKTSMLGEYDQRDKTLEGYHSGIMNYANGLILGGQATDPQSAIRLAVQNTIADGWGFTPPINGRILAVRRKRDQPEIGPLGLNRTDEEIRDIGYNAQALLWQLDPRQVRVDDATARAIFPNMPTGDLERANYIRNAIGQGGFFVSGKTTQDATLYVKNDAGQVQQLVDVHGRPFRVRFDDIPSRMVDTLSFPVMGLEGFEMFPPPHRAPLPNAPITVSGPSDIWGIVTGGGAPGFFPTPGRGSSTNWPTTSPAFLDQLSTVPAVTPGGMRVPPTPVQKLPKK